MQTLKKKLRQVILPLLAFLAVVNVYSQTNGSVEGVVIDISTAEYLPGAHVTLVENGLRATTDERGRFYFSNVPIGTYTITTTYLGLKDYSSQITVNNPGERVKLEILMESEYEALDEVVISGNRFGQSKALNIRKEAENVKNVVSEEQIERFPDLNTAEVLQRVPGVTIQRSNGEGRFVQLRGTSPNLTNVMVNGQQLAVSNGSQRVVELDVISAGQLAGIEVTKVVTPDMDGNAVGGAVNLRTRSAFEYNEPQLGIVMGSGKNSQVDDLGLRGDFTYSNIFGKKDNIGISLSANFTRTVRESNTNESRWGDEEALNGTPLPLIWREITLRESQNQRDRLGLSGQFEFKFNENNRIYASAMFNKRWDLQTRNDLRARFDRGDYVSPTEAQGTRFIRAMQDREERQAVSSYDIGGEHRLNKLNIDYKISFSEASTKKPLGQITPEFQARGIDVLLFDVDSKTPNFSVTNGVDVLDGGIYSFDATDFRIEDTNNQIFTANLNFALPMSLGEGTGEFKFGGRFRSNNKDRGDTRARWFWEGDEDLLLTPFLSNRTINNFQDVYNLGRAVDADGFRNFFLNNQNPNGFVLEDRPDVNFGEPYDAGENVTGIYLMGTQTFGKLLILGGVRAEFMNTDYTGTRLLLDDGFFVSAEEENVQRDFTNIFPNLQFRYRVTDNTNIRMAYSRGFAQPNFFDLVPYSIIDIEERRIQRGNGNLDLTTSNNYDLLGEHFFKGIGVISGGLFLKDINNFVFTSVGVVNGGEFDGFDFEEPVNGGGAQLFGAELSWQQQFSFLPGFLNGFGIFTNYTFTNSSNIDIGSDTQRDDLNVLPQQVAHSGNAALFYEKYGFNVRLAANFTGKFIDEVGQSVDRDEWRDSYTQWDFSFSKRFAKNYDLYFEWINIFNEGVYDYFGVPTRSLNYQINGSVINLGIKWSLN
jgi:TonB-dependent receptor